VSARPVRKIISETAVTAQSQSERRGGGGAARGREARGAAGVEVRVAAAERLADGGPGRAASRAWISSSLPMS
jgi:hypothetical protein